MYKDKTIIISCAGMGKRLGMNIPKALVDVNRKPLIIHTLEMLNDCKDVRIVVGYKADEVIKVVSSYRKDVTFVYNNDYMNNGAGASISLAVSNTNKYVVAMVGDLIIHPEDMRQILVADGDFGCLCDKTTDNPILATLKGDKIVKFSREIGDYEWTGVCQFEAKRFKAGVGNIHQLFETFLPANYMFLRAKEIDTPNDYENALKWLQNGFIDM